jgi:hypothetical protein
VADVSNEDWLTALGAMAGLSNMPEADREASTDLKWLRIHNALAVERSSLAQWIQEQLEDPALIGSILRRMVSENLISPLRATSRDGQSIRVHSLYQRRLNEAYETLGAD